jgi:hypothetical protein
MKHKLLILLMIAFSAQVWSQEGPVAVDDYFHAKAGDTITINVRENDYHPDGLNFKVQVASNCLSHTDSTITFYIDYHNYWMGYMLEDTLKTHYILVDENNLSGMDAQGFVFVLIEPHLCCNYLDINNIQAYIEPLGDYFINKTGNDTTSPTFEFPKRSGNNTIKCADLWVGGIDDIGDIAYSSENHWQGGWFINSGPLNVVGTELSSDHQTFIKWSKVWKLTKEEVEYHASHFLEEGYEPIEDIATWPAHGDPTLHQAEELAPYVDVDGDGHYNPMNGDYPLIRGDQCTYYILNDVLLKGSWFKLDTHQGLGFEYHVMSYAFHSDKSTALNNTIFVSYKIYNRSNHTYRDTYIGCDANISIGNKLDNFMGCDVERSAYYGYNGDDYDEDYYGNNPPTQAVVLLGGPLLDANGQDNPIGECNESINGVGFGDGVVDNERFGMTGFVAYNDEYTNNQGNPYASPSTYYYLQGLWLDGTSVQYGGDGSFSNGACGPNARFMFPGTSDPCHWGTGGVPPQGQENWTEITAGNTPRDRWGVGSMGPFTFEPGSMERIDIAYVASFADPGETAVETLMRSVDEVRAKYLENPTYFGYQWLGMEQNQINPQENKLVVYPNPVSNNLTFSYNENGGEANYILTDMMGKIEMTGKPDRNESHTLDVSQLNPGIYVLSVISDNGNYTTKVIKY